MTKVYLVVRKHYYNEKLEDVSVNEVFTNLKKAKALKRYFDATDKLDNKIHPSLKSIYKAETIITTMNICNFDYSGLASKKEMELELPF